MLDAQTFEVKGRWENGGERPPLNYDFWYQPRKNVLVSSEFGEPNAYEPGFDLADVEAGRYGQRIHFWNLEQRTLEQTIDLGQKGLVPLEGALAARPDADQGFVGAALSSVMLRFQRPTAPGPPTLVIEVDRSSWKAGPSPFPGLITDLVLSMDDRFLYFANWLHGDVRQYDISNPGEPEAHRSGLARRGARQAERRPARPEPAARTCCSSPSTAAACTSPTRCTRPGTTSSTPSCAPGCCESTVTRRAAWRSITASSSTSTTVPTGRRAPMVRLQNGDCTTEIFQ